MRLAGWESAFCWEHTVSFWRFLAIWLLTASFGVLCTSCAKQPAPPPSAFAGALEDYGVWLADDSPESSSRAVADAPASVRRRLNDRSALQMDLRRTAALRGLAQFSAFDPKGLQPNERAQLEIILAHFQSLQPGAELNSGRFSALYGFKPYTLDPYRGAFASLPRFFMGRHPIANLADADDYVERLKGVAPGIRAELVRARAEAASGVIPPAALLQRVLAATDAMLASAPADSPFVRSLQVRLETLAGPLSADGGGAPPADAAPNPARERAQTFLRHAEGLTREEIFPAYREVQILCRDLLARTPRSDPNRSQQWRWAGLSYVAGGPVDRQETEAQAQARLMVLSRELDMSLRSVGRLSGSVAARLSAMDQDTSLAQPDDGQALAGTLRALSAKAERLRATWFEAPLPEKFEFRPLSIWETRGRGLLSYERPGRSPVTPGIVLVNPEGLSHVPRNEMGTLAFHETIPGHHAQSTYPLSESGGGHPLALQLIQFPAFSEGWASYAEQLADEFGLYDGEPLSRIGYLRWQLIRTLRLLVDAGLHDRGWSRDQAIAFLQDQAGLSGYLAADEVDRMLAAPGWGSAYELGRKRIVAARDRARLALGAQFDIRRFHAVVLGAGEIPLDVMDRRVDRWITETLGRSPSARRLPG